MSPRNGWRTGLLAVTACLLAAGCRAKPLPEPELRARLEQQGAEREKLQSLSCSYDLTIAGRRPDGRRGRLSCSGEIVAARGQGLRMRGSKALGMVKLFDFAMTGDRYELSFLFGQKHFGGSVSRVLERHGAAELLGTGRPQLDALLFPVPPDGQLKECELTYRRGEAQLVWRGPEGEVVRRLVVDAANARPLRTEILTGGRSPRTVILHGRPMESAGLHPLSGFKVRSTSERKFRLDVDLSKIELNVEVNPAAFVLKPVEGFKVIDVDSVSADPAVAGEKSAQ
jgi:hypothetical protein